MQIRETVALAICAATPGVVCQSPCDACAMEADAAMLVLHEACSEEENDRLRAENALLREALTEICEGAGQLNSLSARMMGGIARAALTSPLPAPAVADSRHYVGNSPRPGVNKNPQKFSAVECPA